MKGDYKKLGLSKDNLIEMYKCMVLARKIDEKNWLLNRAGKVPFVVSGQGHEAAHIAMAYALDKTKDYIAPYYRDLGVVLTFGMTAKEIYLSYFAKKEDPNSGGKQMPHHFSSKKLRIITQSSPVTTQLLHATGVAYACKIEGRTDVVCMTSLGEGSSNQGDFHEALNFAAIYKLPVIFACENNEYAISTPLDKQVAIKNIADRAAGYGMAGYTVDGLDLLQSYEVMKKAVDKARNGEGPALVEFKVKRFTAHTSDDNASLYMTPEEIAKVKQRDPLALCLEYLKNHSIITEEDNKAILLATDKIVEEAIEYAEKAESPKAEEALNHVYS